MKCLRTAKALTCLIVSCLPFSSISQNSKIDSLKSLLANRSGVEYIDLLFEISRSYADSQNELSFKYVTEAFVKSRQIGDSLRIVKTGRLKSQLFRRLNRIDSSIVLYQQLLPIAKRHGLVEETSTILNGLGLANLFLANYDDALEFFFECLKWRTAEGDKLGMGIALNNIGLVYLNLKDYDQAIAYYYRSLHLENEVGGHIDKHAVYINISLCLAHKHNFSEARNVVSRILADCDNNCSEDVLQSVFNNLGVISFLEGNFKDAKQHFLKSYRLNKKLIDSRLELENLGYLLKISLLLDQLGDSEQYLNEIEKLIGEGIPYNFELIQVYPKLWALYAKSRNYEKVAFHQSKYIALKDSIFDEQLTTNLMRIQSEYLEKENKAKIESQNKILALNQEVILRQKYLNISIGLVALLLVTVTALLLKSNRQKQKMNGLLDVKVRERTKELELNRDALQRACEERDIVIDKTSSDIKMSLVTIKGLCSVGLKDVKDPVALQYIHKMDSSSDKFSEILRRLQLTKSSTFPNVS